MLLTLPGPPGPIVLGPPETNVCWGGATLNSSIKYTAQSMHVQQSDMHTVGVYHVCYDIERRVN